MQMRLVCISLAVHSAPPLLLQHMVMGQKQDVQ